METLQKQKQKQKGKAPSLVWLRNFVKHFEGEGSGFYSLLFLCDKERLLVSIIYFKHSNDDNQKGSHTLKWVVLPQGVRASLISIKI